MSSCIMQTLWQKSLRGAHVSPEHIPEGWPTCFAPEHTCWGNPANPDVYRWKAQSFKVQFLERACFLSVGIRVIKEYVAWCQSPASSACSSASIYLLDKPLKVRQFLDARTEAARTRWTPERTSLPEEAAYHAFHTAIAPLTALARWQGALLTGTFLDAEEVWLLREELLATQCRARAKVRDYAASSRFVTKRLTVDESQNMGDAWWNGTAAQKAAQTSRGREVAQMRGLLLHCLQKAAGRRGMDLRHLRISMLFCHTLPHVKPVASCPVVGASLRQVKECRDNVEHVLGWCRARNRWECPLGALAGYLVWLNDVHGLDLLGRMRQELEDPTQDGPRAWWSLMLLSAGDLEEPMSYGSHWNAQHASYRAAEVSAKTAITHIYRNQVACDLLERGVSIQDVGAYQGWYHDTAADRYLRASFKANPMLVAHGWEEGNEDFACWWEGTDADLPEELKATIFPGLDALTLVAEEAYQSQRKDLSAVAVCRTLQLLRRIYLEDSVVKQPVYPEFPAYARHPLFADPRCEAAHLAWQEYRVAELTRTTLREKAHGSEKKEELMGIIQTCVHAAMASFVHETPGVGLTQVPIGRPAEEHPQQIPDIPEPSHLFTAYAHWQKVRTYFYQVAHPPWKKQLGAQAGAIKLRFSRMRPFFLYLDRCGAQARRALGVLEDLRKEQDVLPSVFIKQCFYHVYFPLRADAPKQPPIPADAIVRALQEAELPPPAAHPSSGRGDQGA